LLFALSILRITFGSYPKGGTFTTKLNLKNECLINHKTVVGTRNPTFWVGAVTSCPSICGGWFIDCDDVSLRLGRHTLLQALACVLACGACKCV
jgi:hypothetical protein